MRKNLSRRSCTSMAGIHHSSIYPSTGIRTQSPLSYPHSIARIDLPHPLISSAVRLGMLANLAAYSWTNVSNGFPLRRKSSLLRWIFECKPSHSSLQNQKPYGDVRLLCATWSTHLRNSLVRLALDICTTSKEWFFVKNSLTPPVTVGGREDFPDVMNNRRSLHDVVASEWKN
jgi:hypothetical protein